MIPPSLILYPAQLCGTHSTWTSGWLASLKFAHMSVAPGVVTLFVKHRKPFLVFSWDTFPATMAVGHSCNAMTMDAPGMQRKVQIAAAWMDQILYLGLICSLQLSKFTITAGGWY